MFTFWNEKTYYISKDSNHFIIRIHMSYVCHVGVDDAARELQNGLQQLLERFVLRGMKVQQSLRCFLNNNPKHFLRSIQKGMLQGTIKRSHSIWLQVPKTKVGYCLTLKMSPRPHMAFGGPGGFGDKNHALLLLLTTLLVSSWENNPCCNISILLREIV